MIHDVAVAVANKMACNDVIQPEKVNVYAYGLELMISSAFGIVALFGVSIVLKRYWLWVPYLIGFVPIRLTGGGYHAKTHCGCIVSFTICYILTYGLYAWFGTFQYFPIISAVITMLIIICLAPVAAVNKPLKERIRKRNRYRCLVIGVFNTVLALVVCIISGGDAQSYGMYCMGFSAAGFSLIAARLIIFWERRGMT